MPLEEMVPGPFVLHVTAVLELPVTVAVNCWLAAAFSCTAPGDTDTETVGEVPLTLITPPRVVGVTPVPSLSTSAALDN